MVMPVRAHAQEIFWDEILAVRTQLEQQQYEQALSEIRALRQFDFSHEQELTLTLHEGLVFASMGPRFQERALATFRWVLLQEPQIRLPLKVSSRIVRDFEDVRALVLAEKRAADASRQASGSMLVRREASGVRVLLPTLAGGGLLISGGLLWGLARKEEARLQSVDPDQTTGEELQRMSSRGKTYQMLGYAAMGAGIASLGVVTVLHLRHKRQAPMMLGLGTDGASVSIHGRWP